MTTPILATKLYIPPHRTKVVLRPRLTQRLNEGLQRKLMLISAPAGFGKTTLISEWLAESEHAVAWLSLDAGDSDPTRFLTYLVVALQTISPNIGKGVLGALLAPQPPPIESILTILVNEIATIPDDFVLVLDDYHVIDAPPVDHAMTFLLEHLPPQMHMIIATREDPQLSLARLRARNQLTEVRVNDLRFTPAEAAGFLTQVMALELSENDITALETRTEGWIVGLQLAAISMQGHQDVTGFIQSFTGNHQFVLDYLVEEVLHQQPENVQRFLLHTSILERMCGALCDAVLRDSSGQAVLEYIGHANLFLIPLDNERRWYRYHHLFGELLRQRLQQSGSDVSELHLRASQWFEDNDLEIEAFLHAAAANDVERAARLIEGDGMPLLFRGAIAPVLKWLESLPTTVLDSFPVLWIMYASSLLFVNQLPGIEPKLQAAETALQGAELNAVNRDHIGHIASIRATVAVSQHQIDTILTQSKRALEYLHPENLPVRTATTWTLAYAYQLQGDRAAARQAYTEAVAISQSIGHFIIHLLSTMGIANIQELDNQLHQAEQTFQQVLQLIGEPPLAVGCEVHLGLARIYYEWNDLDAAQHHYEEGVPLARQIYTTDRSIAFDVMLARLKLAQGNITEATTILAQAAQSAHQQKFLQRLPEIAAVQVLTLLAQGNLNAAAQLTQKYDLPLSQARVYLAQGDTSAALAVLNSYHQQAVAQGWVDEQLKAMVLQTVVLAAHGAEDQAVRLLGDALLLAQPAGIVRLFVDEGLPMSELLSAALDYGIMPDYARKLLEAFDVSAPKYTSHPELIEPLTTRELEVLRLIAQGLSNHEISERLFLALSTVKGHNRIIFDKLQVQRRTEAVARARELGLI